MPPTMQERLQALDAMPLVDGLTELRPDRVQRTTQEWLDPRNAGVCYFRVPDPRMARGRIALLQNGHNAIERVMYRDYVMFRQYGNYKGANQPADWQMADPHLGIIERGGLPEYDAPQIIDLYWHYRPDHTSPGSHRLIWAKVDALIGQGMTEAEAVYAVMPQIDGHDLTVHTCEACGPDRKFSTAQAARSHRSIMHPADVQSVGTRDAIVQALQGGGNTGGNSDLTALLIEQNRMLMELLADKQSGAPRRGRPPKAPDDDTAE